MIGVDTNVLIRLIVLDDQAQHALARSFFEQRSPADPAFISVAVVMEFIWVLDRSYGYAKEQIAKLLLSMLDSPELVLERHRLVQQAALLAAQPKVGLADCLIAAIATEAGCSSTVTFDRMAAKRLPGMDLLA